MHVFPNTDLPQLGVAVAHQIKSLLLNGSMALGVDGLSVRPQFTNRKGAGGGRDTTLYTTARVIYPGDLAPGTPYVTVVGIAPRGRRDDWSTNQWIMGCVAVLDCYANTLIPQGVDGAQTADAVLGDYVEFMLLNRDLGIEYGLTNSDVAREVPSGATFKGVPFEFHFPLTFEFEIYIAKA